MSYDLYFYKPKGKDPSEEQIAKYLSDNLVPKDESESQWFFENEDTDVYYFIDQNEPNDDPESIELYDSFEDFDNTNFSFNINYLRPSFFGLEAFEFVEKLITDLDLSVLNPQSDTAGPYKPTKAEMFENWNDTNLWSSAKHFEEGQTCYLPAEQSNAIWNYNINRARIQSALGNQYFVPRIFFFKTRKTNEVVTVSSWAEHIPNVIPPADYFLLTREYRKLFRTIKDRILVSRETIEKCFGSHFSDFYFPNCKIIHPENAARVKDKFNSLKGEHILADFAARLPMEDLYNAKPD